MNPNLTNTRSALTSNASRTALAERLLRDAAFVLKMTRRVKDDIQRTTESRPAAGFTRTAGGRPHFESAV